MNKSGKSGKSYSGINSMDAPTDGGRGFFGEESDIDGIVDVERDEEAELNFGDSDHRPRTLETAEHEDSEEDE